MMFLARIIRAHETENPIRFIRIGRPDFLPIDDVMIAFIFGFGFEGR